MSFQRSELLDQLPQQGWNLTNLEDHSESPQLEWWADEMWILQSTWSPQGCRVYLTFLVDPDTNIQGRKKGDGVWAMKASLTRPKQWMSEKGEINLTLGHGWQERLPGFLEQLAALRTRHRQNVATSGELL